MGNGKEGSAPQTGLVCRSDAENTRNTFDEWACTALQPSRPVSNVVPGWCCLVSSGACGVRVGDVAQLPCGMRPWRIGRVERYFTGSVSPHVTTTDRPYHHNHEASIVNRKQV